MCGVYTAVLMDVSWGHLTDSFTPVRSILLWLSKSYMQYIYDGEIEFPILKYWTGMESQTYRHN